MQSSRPGRRNVEIEEITNLYVIHPIAGALVRVLARWRVKPNAVSVFGMACGILAGVAYYGYEDAFRCVLGFALMVAWHIMDGTDGQLARATHSQSDLGKILDGACDYTTFVATYAAFALASNAAMGPWMWPLVALAGISHAVQSAAYEAQREEYDFWTEDGHGAQPIARALRRRGGRAAPIERLVTRVLYRPYVWLQRQATSDTFGFHARLTSLLERQPGRVAEARALYRRLFSPAVRRWAVLAANYRTIGIFIAALFAAPQYYFAFEILGLNALLVLLHLHNRAIHARFFDLLEASG